MLKRIFGKKDDKANESTPAKEAGTEPRRLSVGDLRSIVRDAGELAKGTQIFDSGALLNLSRHGTRLFADARGSGKSPYRVSALVEESRVVPRCTCFAARTRPYCKHAAALLVAWARAPESFLVADAAPPEVEEGKKKKTVKKGKREAAELMRQGVDQIQELSRELAVAGIASLTAERVGQIQSLGENLRDFRLRRLSARALDLTELLKASLGGDVDAVSYANLVTDLVLTAAKIEKHLDGEPLDPAHVEELVGKTWRKQDRAPVDSLKLVEYAYSTRITSDDYVIRESRYVDVSSGKHYGEKQILPAFLAKNTEPKKSYEGKLLDGASGSIYPGYAPYRLDLESVGKETALAPDTLAALVESAFPSVSDAVDAFRDHRKDVFAPERYPVGLRVERVLAADGRLQAVDGGGRALHLPFEPGFEEGLEELLRARALRALVGEISSEMAIPILRPMAAVAELRGSLELLRFDGNEAGGGDLRGRSWAQAARRAGLSPVAISLAEVRGELAQGLLTGLTALGPRTTEPLAERLWELGLEKPAALLKSISEKADPAGRVGDFVKLYQVLELAMIRLGSASEVDLEGSEPVAGHPSIFVKKPTVSLRPKEIARARAAGQLNRFEVALHFARAFDEEPVEKLLGRHGLWADGSSASYLSPVLARYGDRAVAAASDVLHRRVGRMAKLTAILVLGDVGSEKAREVLEWFAFRHTPPDEPLRLHAMQALSERWSGEREAARLHESTRARVRSEINEYHSLSDASSRAHTVHGIGLQGAAEAIPFLRGVLRSDPARPVREEAALALGQCLDAASLDTFVALLENRSRDDRAAKNAAKALAALGDVRGIPALLSAYRSDWKGSVVADCLNELGLLAVDPILDFVEENPGLAKRDALQMVLHKAASPPVFEERILARLSAPPEPGRFLERASALLEVAKAHDEARKRLAARILELTADAADKETKSLRRAAIRAIGSS